MHSVTLTLLRHGLCEGETEGRYIGHTEAPLTAEGRQQLLQLRETMCYPSVDALFLSPESRCRESASLLYGGHTPIELADFREYFFGEFENKSPCELEDHPVYHRWLAGEPGLTPPFAEELPAFQNRLSQVFIKLCDGLLKTKTNAALITHGGVIMTLLMLFGLPEAPMHEWLTPSGCGFTVRLEPTLWLRGQKAEVAALAPEEPETPWA